jgi:hypothetical protein
VEVKVGVRRATPPTPLGRDVIDMIKSPHA